VDLNGKAAIVTGASRGIGRQIALELGRRGVSVAVAARSVEQKGRLPGTVGETVGMIEAAGGRAIAVQADVTREADIGRLVDETVQAFGRLDIVINNAADTRGVTTPIEAYPRDVWLRQFDSNVHGPFTMISLAVPHLRAQGGGVIVNMTSSSAELVEVKRDPGGGGAHHQLNLIGYGATKAALNRLSNAVAPYLVADNIAVVCLDPGGTRTELMEMMGERGLIDPSHAHPMAWPVEDVLTILTADDPLQYAGQILRTDELHAG